MDPSADRQAKGGGRHRAPQLIVGYRGLAAGDNGWANVRWLSAGGPVGPSDTCYQQRSYVNNIEGNHKR